MRASELLGCVVSDAEGTDLGRIHDLRFRVEGSPGTNDLALVLESFVCSAVSRGHAMGYGSGDMKGPWPLKSIFERIHSRTREFSWHDVVEVRPGAVRLAVTNSDRTKGNR